MQFKSILTINAILAFASGVACVLAPAQMLAFYGVTLDSMGLVIYQFWGTALIGLGMLTWFLRNIQVPGLNKTIALSLLITNGLSTVMAIRGQFAGANSFGWSTVALFLLLTIAWSLFLLLGRNTIENKDGVSQ